MIKIRAEGSSVAAPRPYKVSDVMTCHVTYECNACVDNDCLGRLWGGMDAAPRACIS